MPKGRPKGSKNKSVEEKIIEKEAKPGRGRPAGSKNLPKAPLPPTVDKVPEPIRGFQEVMRAFGDKGYISLINIPKMELLPDDMVKAIEKYQTKFNTEPKCVILNERNEKLLPYLYAQIPDLECGLAGGTALWEIKLQVP